MHLEYLEPVTLFEAKELAKTILKNEKSASESLAELLTLIYGQKIKLEELKQTDKSNLQINSLKNDVTNEIIAHSRELRTHSKQLGERYKELSSRFITLKAMSLKFTNVGLSFKQSKKK